MADGWDRHRKSFAVDADLADQGSWMIQARPALIGSAASS